MPRPIVVFDLDGTLVDTAPDLIDTLNIVFADEGIPPLAHAEARPLIGGGVRPLIERALQEQHRTLAAAEVDGMFGRFLVHYREHIADRSLPFPGLEAALDELAGRDCLLAVCTNKFEDLSVLLLDKLGLRQRFAAICGQDTFSSKKPDPDVLLQTIRRAAGNAARAVMVGDSGTDIRTARGAGIPVIGVNFGYSDTPMNALAPDRLIGHFDLLPDAVVQLLEQQPPAEIGRNRTG